LASTSGVSDFANTYLGSHAFTEEGVYVDARDNNTIYPVYNPITEMMENGTVVKANQAFLINESIPDGGGYEYTYEVEYSTGYLESLFAPSEATLIGEFRGIQNSDDGNWSLDVDIDISMNSIYGGTTPAYNLASIDAEYIDINERTYVDFSGTITGASGEVTITEDDADSSGNSGSGSSDNVVGIYNLSQTQLETLMEVTDGGLSAIGVTPGDHQILDMGAGVFKLVPVTYTAGEYQSTGAPLSIPGTPVTTETQISTYTYATYYTPPVDSGGEDHSGSGSAELPYFNLNQNEANDFAPPIKVYLSAEEQSGGMFAIATKDDGTGDR
jgi:hypothetical protein